MNITIISPSARKLEEYINKSSQGNTVTSFLSTQDFYNKVNHNSHRTNIIMILDEALVENKDFEYLLDTLYHRFLSCDKVLFLNKEDNPTNLDRYNFIMEDIKSKKLPIEIVIKVASIYKSSDLLEYIKEGVFESEVLKKDDMVVIQTKRTVQRQILGNSSFQEEEVDGTFTDNYYNPTHQGVAKLYQNDTTEINLTSQIDIPNIDVETFQTEMDKLDRVLSHQTKPLLKYLTVTGTQNSGVTTTVLSLGHIASQYGKVLLIDCNPSALGLSWLSELYQSKPILFPTNIHRIPVTDILNTNIVQAIRNHTTNSSPIHILSLDYKLTKRLDVSMLMTNILNIVKDNYRYVIFDIPLDEINNFSQILNLSDKVIVTNIPYVHKTIHNLNKIKQESILPNTKHFLQDTLLLFNVGIPSKNGVPTLTRTELNYYTQNILGKEIPTLKVFQLIEDNYQDCKLHFETIMEVETLWC